MTSKSELFQIKFHPFNKSFTEDFRRIFPGYEEGLVRSEPGGLVMPSNYGLNAAKIYEMTPRKDDVWLVTFPKCGTTWTSELLWLLMNDCDFDSALRIPLMNRALFPERLYLSPEKDRRDLSNFRRSIITPSQIERLPSPRLIRPHLPFYLLPPNLLDTSKPYKSIQQPADSFFTLVLKVVYVTRNPKDVIVSFYYHHKLIKIQGFQGTIEDFAHYFMNDEVIYSPFFPHVLDAWNKRHHPNLHFMFYEDMKRDLGAEIEKVANFLNKKLSHDQLDRLKDHLRFENMRENDAVNNESGKKLGIMNEDGKFMRKGEVGDWKHHFSPELSRKVDQWIEKNLAGTNLRYVTELEDQND